MANTNETSADIIAEIRDLAEGVMHCMLLPTVYGKPSIYLAELADRLAAARKREKAAIEADALAVGGLVEASRATTENSSAVGDAAHRRELSKNTSKNGGDFGQLGDVAKLREALVRFVRAYEQTDEMANIEATAEAYDLARAALASPARNCDIHTDFNDAITTLANKRNWHDGKWNSERYCIFASWLLATSTEQEGRNNVV